MSYTKQNFKDGQTLKAEHLNNMEDGIVNLENAVVALEEAISGMSGGSMVTTFASGRIPEYDHGHATTELSNAFETSAVGANS